jgi:CheY-like chemotaxis protein
MQAEIARALLEKAGHSVVTYSSGNDVLQDRPAGRPDCILLDIMMPGLDGYELCRRLRAMKALAGTKLVMMSTKAYPFDRARAFEVGADGYFQTAAPDQLRRGARARRRHAGHDLPGVPAHYRCRAPTCTLRRQHRA